MISIIVLVSAVAHVAYGQGDDCAITGGPTTACSVTCGGGLLSSNYTVDQREQNGGLSCDDTLLSANSSGGLDFGLEGDIVSFTDFGSFYQVVKRCNKDACPSECIEDITDGPCSATCGPGTFTRFIARKKPAFSNVPDLQCFDEEQTIDCSGGTCPCIYTEVPGPCSTTCGLGTRTVTIDITDLGYPHDQCPPDREDPCEVECPCEFTEEDGPCDTTCGIGEKTSIIDIIHPGYPLGSCPSPTTTPCEVPCPCEFTEEDGPCDTTCGIGEKTSIINIIHPGFPVGNCPTPETTHCEVPCPCEFTVKDGPCSTTCGQGTTTSIVDITNPGFPGNDCPAPETTPCEVSCPCEYTQEEEACSVTCGTGTKRIRTVITNPGFPTGTCPPDEFMDCILPPCTKACYKCYDKECKHKQDVPSDEACPEHQFDDFADCEASCVPCIEQRAVDVVFLLDISGSIGNPITDFIMLKEFAKDVVDILPTDRTIGIVSFNSQSFLDLTFTQSSGMTNAQVKDFIDTMIMQPMSTTNHAIGLQRVLDDLLNTGMNRAGIPDVVVTITDGEPFPTMGPNAVPDVGPVADAVRATGARTIAVGVGTPGLNDVLNKLAGGPGTAFLVDQFDQLGSIIDDLNIINPCPPNKDDKVAFGNYLYDHRYHGSYSPFKHSGSIFNYPRGIGPHGVGAGDALLSREQDRVAHSHTQREQFCSFPVARGHGHQALSRYFYNPYLGICQHFIYTGEGGNPNCFLSKNQCDDACGRLADEGVAPPEAPFYNKYGGFHDLI